MNGPPIESHSPGTPFPPTVPIAPLANTTAAALWILDHVVDREINKLRISWLAGRSGRESVKNIECALRMAANHAAGRATVGDSRDLNRFDI